MSIKAFFFGIVASFMAYCILADEFINNVFGTILFMAVVVGNMFYLLLGIFPFIQIIPSVKLDFWYLWSSRL